MKLEQAADSLKMDLKTTLSRFGGQEQLLMRFLTRLPGDPTFRQLEDAMAAKDWKMVEMSAHTLKGVAANLGLEELRFACDAVVVAVRQGRTEQLPQLMPAVREAFESACRIIWQLEG